MDHAVLPTSLPQGGRQHPRAPDLSAFRNLGGRQTGLNASFQPLPMPPSPRDPRSAEWARTVAAMAERNTRPGPETDYPVPAEVEARETRIGFAPSRQPLRSALKSLAAGARSSQQGLTRIAASATAASRAIAERTNALGRTGMRMVTARFAEKEDRLARTLEGARFSVLSNRFKSLAPLSAAETGIIEDFGISERRTHQAGTEICVAGESSPSPMFIVSGWACRVRVISKGRRLILGLLLPGDGIATRGCAEPLSGSTIMALTTVETVDARKLLRMAENAEEYPGIHHAIQRAAVQEESFTANQMVRLGAQNPAEGLANLLLELRWRLLEAGMATEQEFPLPLTHDTLADTLGVSVRRIKGAMGRLNAGRLASTRFGRATVWSPGQLRTLGEFRAPDACSCGRMRMAISVS
ncbi:MAG: hypothetical protein SGJ21_01415 [Alphaproteobacteria bacterium]|nr:hypothetical protein [Alphaproteobacteria bacterium]